MGCRIGPFLLIAIAVFTFLKRDFGMIHAPKLTRVVQFSMSIAAGMTIGFLRWVLWPRHRQLPYFCFYGYLRF